MQITSDNIQISPSMRKLAEKKASKIIEKLKDFPKDQIDLRIVLNRGDGEKTFVAKVSFNAYGKKIIGEDFEYNLESALIKAIDDAFRQLKKEKDKKESEDWKERRNYKVFKYQ